MAAPEVPSSHTYLLDAPTLTLATIDPNGRPQLSQIWFLAEDGVIKTGLNMLRQKVKNLEANYPDSAHDFPEDAREIAYRFFDRHLKGDAQAR